MLSVWISKSTKSFFVVFSFWQYLTVFDSLNRFWQFMTGFWQVSCQKPFLTVKNPTLTLVCIIILQCTCEYLECVSLSFYSILYINWEIRRRMEQVMMIRITKHTCKQCLRVILQLPPWFPMFSLCSLILLQQNCKCSV